MQQNTWDVIIAGGGAAGLSAALLLGRSRRRVLVIDAGSPRNRHATHMHGVLGMDGISPRELLSRGRIEAASYGVEFSSGSIQQVDRKPGGLHIVTDDGTERNARALIVATGLTDELPDIPGLAQRWGISVLHCPYCHGWEVRDRHLGVLLTSPFGLHQAELVRGWSDRITVFTAGFGQLTDETEQRLRARGIALEPAPVTAIIGEGTAITAVQLAAAGEKPREVPVEALFTTGTPKPHDGFLTSLNLQRNQLFLAVDPTGKTSDDRIWAVGNVVNPAATVPMSIGAGALTGGAVNAALVGWDFDTAVSLQLPPADYWEQRYAGSDRVWSGKVNQVLADIATSLRPGRALDLGCGEGGDVIWLAQHGWQAVGIDISRTAIDRAQAAAEASGLSPDRAHFAVADLADTPAGSFDLVTASFLHSRVELPRAAILRQAAECVAPGGHLLITSHAHTPPWAPALDGHQPHFLGPQEEVDQLALDPNQWTVMLSETRTRQATGPDGSSATLDDVVVLIRRQ